MDRIDSINLDRIRWCAAECGVSLDDLAIEAGIPAKALSAQMDDGVGLTFAQLKKLADYFGRGALFFLDTGALDEQRVHTAQYRTLTNQKPELPLAIKKLIERVERHRELYLSLREDFYSDNFLPFDPPAIGAHRPEAAAATIRTWLGLGIANTFEKYRQALERLGILVIRSNGYAGQWQIAKDSPILGFSLYHAVCPVIVVKASRWENQQTFTLMHELGHLILHRASSIDDDSDMRPSAGQLREEREANAFAGHLLVPDAFLGQIRDTEQPEFISLFDDWLAPYGKQWGVSVEMILRRLMDAGRLTQDRYSAYRSHARGLVLPEEQGGNRAFRHREPKHIFGNPFVRTVIDALAARRISTSKACAYLDGLKLSDLHQLERHVTGH